MVFLATRPGVLPRPDQNGGLAEGELDPADTTGRRWVGQAAFPGGQAAAVYAVAYNQHGRTVSPVLAVAWYEGSEYGPDELKHP